MSNSPIGLTGNRLGSCLIVHDPVLCYVPPRMNRAYVNAVLPLVTASLTLAGWAAHAVDIRVINPGFEDVSGQSVFNAFTFGQPVFCPGFCEQATLTPWQEGRYMGYQLNGGSGHF